jgi:hypothetical protein
MNKRKSLGLLAALALVGFSGCASPAGEELVDVNPDGIINTGEDINTGVLNEPGGEDVNEGELILNNDVDQDGILNENDDDIDGDGIVNEQDTDIDGDGIDNIDDNDIDGDGIANEQDTDVDGDGTVNEEDTDIDGDGVANIDDNDIDGDGVANEDDTDIDGDGVLNENDVDMDGDGIINEQDTDMDGDGVVNEEDTDMDGDGVDNSVDGDIDGDGVLNENDDDIDGDGVANVDDTDVDGDGIDNTTDTDDDGDGIADTEDDTPNGTEIETSGVVVYDNEADTVFVAVAPGGTEFSGQDEIDFADFRARVQDNNGVLSEVAIDGISIWASASNAAFLQANSTVPCELSVSYSYGGAGAEILRSPELGSAGAMPVLTLGQLVNPIVLGTDFAAVMPGYATFTDLMRDPTAGTVDFSITVTLGGSVSSSETLELNFMVEASTIAATK